MDVEMVAGLQQVVAAVGWTLLTFLWQGAAIALAYALLRTLLGRAPVTWRLALGHLALAGFALAPVLTLLHRLTPAASMPEAAAALGTLAPAATLAGFDAAWSVDPLLPWLVAVWLAGVAVLGARGLVRWLAIRRLCAAAQPLPAQWAQRVERLHDALGVRVRVLVRETAAVAAPIMVGWVKPTILLPIGLCARLPVAQVELILAHELAHVRRLDAWANALQVALETLLFYHPAVHWVGRRIREDREVACDALVAGSGMDRLDLARALLALAEDRCHRSPSGLALAATGGVLLGRVEQLLEVRSPSRSHFEGLLPAAALALGVALLSVPIARQWTQAEGAAAVLPPSLSQPSLARLSPVFDLVVRDLQPRIVSTPAFAIGGEALPAESAARSLPDAVPKVALAPAPAEVAAVALPQTVAQPAFASVGLPVDLAVPDVPEVSTEPPPPILETVVAEPFKVLRREAPEYPHAARLRGLEGSVELSFRIDASGRAADVRVESSVQAMFSAAAREALARWRFPAGSGGDHRYVQRFDFNLVGQDRAERQASIASPDLDERSTGENCQAPTGSRICRRAL